VAHDLPGSGRVVLIAARPSGFQGALPKNRNRLLKKIMFKSKKK